MMMSMQAATSDIVQSLAQLQRVADLALSRHGQAREQSPERAAAAYLRAALASARVMVRHAPQHPALWNAALACIERVSAAAHTAEADLFASGKNSASYFAILIAAESLRLTIADKMAAGPGAAPRPSRRVSGTLLPSAMERGNARQQAVVVPQHPARGVNVLARQRR